MWKSWIVVVQGERRGWRRRASCLVRVLPTNHHGCEEDYRYGTQLAIAAKEECKAFILVSESLHLCSPLQFADDGSIEEY